GRPGCQIVVSSATAALVSSDLQQITLRPLGDHTLKDIAERVALHQVVAPGLREDFPALRTVGSHPTNLPPFPTALVGREQEVTRLATDLQNDGTRLITLTGPGGTGKTRLALGVGHELLEDFSDGVFVVDLSPVSDASLVVAQIAAALSLRESGGRGLEETLHDYLASKEMLLVIDNFEQVTDAASEVASLLSSASGVCVLVTSREPLRIAGEQEFAVPPLSLPSQSSPRLEEAEQSPAVALFTERARGVRADFALTPDNMAAVVAICRRLDGLPLAIELAAARVKVLSPKGLLERLDHSLRLLSSGRRDASERQRTLRGAIHWSYEILSEDEQKLFRRLGVFSGGWSLEAAEAVCDRGGLTFDVLDGLTSLVDKSLVRAVSGDEERFSMLETIQEFAVDRLDASGEGEKVWRSHAEHFRELAEEAEPNTVQGPQQFRWLEVLEVEHDNLRAALTHLSRLGDGEGQRRLAVALSPFWRLHGHLTEGRRWLLEAVSTRGNDPVLTTRLLTSLGLIAYKQGDYESARAFLEQSLSLSEQLGLEERIDANLNNLGMVSVAHGDYEGARGLFKRSMGIARQNNDKLGVACAAHNLADLALNERDYAAARDLAIESLRLWQELGDAEGSAASLVNAGLATVHFGDTVEATKLLTQALSIARALESKEIVAGCLDGFASIAARAQKVDLAARLLAAAERLRKEIGAIAERFELELHQETLSFLRAELGEDGLSRAISEGQAATPENTIVEALSVMEAIVEPREEPS
ncbi:MAG: ATP-binding protein, partial [Actinomycetota bacterium]